MKEQSRSRRWWILGITVVVAVVIAVVWLWLANRVATVQVTTVRTQTLKNQVFTSGTVRPTERQVIDYTSLPQPFSQFDVAPGAQVAKGQTLITLQNAPQKSALQSAQQAYSAAERTYSQAQAQYSAAPVTLQPQLYPALMNAQAAVGQAKAQLANAQMAYTATLITANFAGKVLMENPMGVAPGGSSAPLLELVGSQSQVLVYVSEVDAVRLRTGMKATITSDAYPNKTWTGHITLVAPYAEQSTSGSGQVEVDISAPTGFNVPLGYAVNVQIVSQTHRNVPVVPYNALVQEGANYAVFVYQNGRVESRPVTLGITGASVVEVTKGLTAGMQVVDNPPANLQTGQVVRAHD
ncbi:efflux RND transporter periplasmic adaptor subunit [Alicyclobacillus sp. ALC3]|uniref:efflux RND transporter periplasmic adaptor subunit n=1 Tax=Alicyclobacillus sp. ALC3 TaxID=2796143 RepID=UPI002378C281|nr:efflux RND transporter periplasmic adaptor subunit [Alicyclobacillus sp. ALC3]WDL95997.1 efflux RND transporter periplasmic adaptor subunit [Alicyclobacillus sp. ALC3]